MTTATAMATTAPPPTSYTSGNVSTTHHHQTTTMPAAQPPPKRAAPPLTTQVNAAKSTTTFTPSNNNNNNNKSTSVTSTQKKKNIKTAVELIRTLDIAFADMTSSAASASEDAEDARRNARAASEVARRYTGRSYPRGDVTGRYRPSPRTGGSGGMVVPRTPQSAVTMINGDYHQSPQQQRQWQTQQQQQQQQTESQSFAALAQDHSHAQPHKPPPAAHPPSPTPRKTTTNNQTNYSAPLSPSSDRKRKIIKSTSASNNTSNNNAAAASYAEDILSLSLELEKTKQALSDERSSHSQTKKLLNEETSKSKRLESTVQRLLEEAESLRESHGRETDRLRAELSRANARVGAAEEDAQLALDLARESGESRQQAEEMLQKAMNEITVLKNGGSIEDLMEDRLVFNTDTPMKDVPKTPSPVETPPDLSRGSASKEMITAGRDLLRRAAYAAPGVNEDGAPTYQVRLLTRMSAEKRQRLRDRLRYLDEEEEEDENDATSRALVPRMGRQIQRGGGKHYPPPPPPRHGGTDLGFAHGSKATNQAVARMLRESGKKLGLGGRWWTGSQPPKVVGMRDDDLESMARSYCKSVEVKIGRQKEEVKELEAFCSYLERRVIASPAKITVSASSEPSKPSADERSSAS